MPVVVQATCYSSGTNRAMVTQLTATLHGASELGTKVRREVCWLLCAEVEFVTLCYCALHAHEATAAVDSPVASLANVLRLGHFQVGSLQASRASPSSLILLLRA